jgi:epoxyqueuosine reductase QueG
MDEVEFYDQMKQTLQALPFADWGIGNIRGMHELSNHFPRALSLLLKYDYPWAHYQEETYHQILEKKSNEMEFNLKVIGGFFAKASIPYFIVPNTGQNILTLKAVFPHQLAAAMAGLGWIGKSGLFIHERYGPQIRLGTVLFDYQSAANPPVMESRCGNCERCVQACPYGCIKNKQWYAGMERSELLDYVLCHEKRLEFLDAIGHKHSCGYCLLACPHGNKA